MSRADDIEEVQRQDILLTEAMLGYDILVAGEHAGNIEGTPGQLEHIEIHPYWEGKRVARAAVNAFIELSQAHGHSTLTTNNAVHPAMEHILETEGFEERSDDIGWMKEI